jgi:hypothetical protein
MRPVRRHQCERLSTGAARAGELRWPTSCQIRPDCFRRNAELTRDLGRREALRQPISHRPKQLLTCLVAFVSGGSPIAQMITVPDLGNCGKCRLW